MPPSCEQAVTTSSESDAQIAHLEETRNVPPACGDGTESSAAVDGRPRPSAGGDAGAAATRPPEQRARNVQNWPAQDAGNWEALESSQTNGRWPDQRQPNPHHPRRQHLPESHLVELSCLQILIIPLRKFNPITARRSSSA